MKMKKTLISNPPYNMKWEIPPFAQIQPRFSKCYVVPPANNANYAFVLTGLEKHDRRNMIIPREIREKIEQRNQLDEEIADWFQENVDVDGCDIKNAYVVDEPKGEEQIEEGEYCKQTILGEDWYIGQYYWKMDNGKYLCMDFEI